MIRVKLYSVLSNTLYSFENLVNYDKSKTSPCVFLGFRKFENLVNYDKSKTKGIDELEKELFENLVNYDKSKTTLITYMN